jgi:hypothetical protein
MLQVGWVVPRHLTVDANDTVLGYSSNEHYL